MTSKEGAVLILGLDRLDTAGNSLILRLTGLGSLIHPGSNVFLVRAMSEIHGILGI